MPSLSFAFVLSSPLVVVVVVIVVVVGKPAGVEGTLVFACVEMSHTITPLLATRGKTVSEITVIN